MSQFINIWDTETTGVKDKDEVIQLSGIITDMDLKVKKVYDFYCFATQEIHPAAFAVNGIDRETLYKKSGGKYLEDILDDNPWFMRDNFIFVAYSQSFDKRMINQTLTNQGLNKVDFGAQIQALRRTLSLGRYNLCAMSLFKHSLNRGIDTSLVNTVLKHSGFTMEQLQELFLKFCTKMNCSSGIERPHSALFDSFLIWVLLSKYKGLVYR